MSQNTLLNFLTNPPSSSQMFFPFLPHLELKYISQMSAYPILTVVLLLSKDLYLSSHTMTRNNGTFKGYVQSLGISDLCHSQSRTLIAGLRSSKAWPLLHCVWNKGSFFIKWPWPQHEHEIVGDHPATWRNQIFVPSTKDVKFCGAVPFLSNSSLLQSDFPTISLCTSV